MKWNKEDDDFLINNYPKYGVKYCMLQLNRTKRAIELRARKLKLYYDGIKSKYHKNNLEEEIDFVTGSALNEGDCCVLNSAEAKTRTSNSVSDFKNETKKSKVQTGGIAGQIYLAIEKELEKDGFLVERPGDPTKGDFACNVAMAMSKAEGKNPRELAEEIVEKLKKNEELL